MGIKEQKGIIDEHVRRYIKKKVQEKFPKDFHLIEPILDSYIDRYTLREILVLMNLEIEKMKRSSLK